MGCCGSRQSETDPDENDVTTPLTPNRIHVPTHSFRQLNRSLTERKKIAAQIEQQDHPCLLCKCCNICLLWSGLKCCCCQSIGEKPFVSIKKERHCTDIPCCLLFVVTLLAQLLLVYYSITNLQADPRWLVYYSDLYGQLCAPTYDEFDFFFNVTTVGNYAAWPDIRMYDVRICVDECDDTLYDDRMVTPSLDADITDIGLDPQTGVTIDISGYQSVNILEAICIPDPEYVSDITSPIINQDYTEFESAFNQLSDKVALAINDVSTAWMLFILCAISALFVSMLWGVLIRHLGSLIIWLSILLTVSGFGLIAYYLIQYSEYAYLFGYETIGDIMYYTGYVLAVLDVMFALAICAMWSRIRLAIALVKETTRAMTAVWSLFFYPLVPFIGFIMYMIYWIIAGIYMSSVTVEKEWPMPLGYKLPYYNGGPTLQTKLHLPDEGATYVYLEIDETWQYLCLFHFFVLLWVINFVSYHTYMVIAGVYAEWYFADWKDKAETTKWRGSDDKVLVVGDVVVHNESDLAKVIANNTPISHTEMTPVGTADNTPVGNIKLEMEEKEELKTIAKLSNCPTCLSFFRVTFNHLGTIAFGSLLIAIIEFIEYTLNYFEKKFVKSDPSPLQKMVLAMIKCILRCVKCILDRINKNGLIITSIYGWPFCASSMKGVTIILSNVIRATALSMVSGYLEKLGKICILSFNVSIIIIFANYYYGNELSSLILPGIICFGITYVICWQYMELYEVGISTIFICFLIDEQHNKSLNEMKASKRLRKIIGAQEPSDDQ